MAEWVAFSVDLEPNKDDTLDGVAEAMDWYDETVPRGTVYATHRIATELPDLIADLSTDHEIGVHVHPREFGHEHDQLAELDGERQREVIAETRTALADAAGIDATEIVAFRAGRHSASETTLAVLADLGFAVDASVNVRYEDYLPASLTERTAPFDHGTGLFELPTTYRRPPLLSHVGFRVVPQRTVTATSTTLRVDSRGCSGLKAMRWLLSTADGISMYMHPYDATAYHDDLVNNGSTFRDRVEQLFAGIPADQFLSAVDVQESESEASDHSGEKSPRSSTDKAY